MITRNQIFGWVGTSLTRKVGLGLFVMALLMLLSIGAVFLQVRQQRDVATVITVAMDQRSAIQRITDDTADAVSGDLRANAVLQRTADEFDWNLRALREGGLTFGPPGSASDLPDASATIQQQLDRIDRIWQPVYGNVTVVSGSARAGVQAKELAVQAGNRFPSLESSLGKAESSATGGDQEALSQIGRILDRVRLQVLDTAQTPQQTAADLADNTGRIDEILETLLSSDARPEGVPLRQELVVPVDGFVALWEESAEDIKALIPLSEEFAEGLEAAGEIAGSSGPLLREIGVAVDLLDDESRDKVTQIQWFLVAVTGVFLYICALAIWVTWRTIRPLERLTRATTAIADGDLSARVDVDSRDEIGMLAAAFNRMTEDLQRRDIELAAVNDELEAFNYSVSHDLRAPLRTIDGFSQALLEDYEDKLDDVGKDYLGRTRAASQRMGVLIDDLLNLSRVTRGDLRREEVDLTAIAKQVIKELEEGDPGRQVTFEIAEGAATMGDPNLLRAVMDNLIGNSWKFTGNHPTAKIEFGISEVDGKPAFYVRDDGAGFDMEYADNLFGAFQRLHGMTEFPGAGIGLATVQRIIHRHGGRVWAEGKVEQGATFYFTIG